MFIFYIQSMFICSKPFLALIRCILFFLIHPIFKNRKRNCATFCNTNVIFYVFNSLYFNKKKNHRNLLSLYLMANFQKQWLTYKGTYNISLCKTQYGINVYKDYWDVGLPPIIFCQWFSFSLAFITFICIQLEDKNWHKLKSWLQTSASYTGSPTESPVAQRLIQ